MEANDDLESLLLEFWRECLAEFLLTEGEGVGSRSSSGSPSSSIVLSTCVDDAEVGGGRSW